MSTYEKQVKRESYERPRPSPQEQAREGGIVLITADPRDVVRKGTTRDKRDTVMRRLYSDDYFYDY